MVRSTIILWMLIGTVYNIVLRYSLQEKNYYFSDSPIFVTYYNSFFRQFFTLKLIAFYSYFSKYIEGNSSISAKLLVKLCYVNWTFEIMRNWKGQYI